MDKLSYDVIPEEIVAIIILRKINYSILHHQISKTTNDDDN